MRKCWCVSRLRSPFLVCYHKISHFSFWFWCQNVVLPVWSLNPDVLKRKKLLITWKHTGRSVSVHSDGDTLPVSTVDLSGTLKMWLKGSLQPFHAVLFVYKVTSYSPLRSRKWNDGESYMIATSRLKHGKHQNLPWEEGGGWMRRCHIVMNQSTREILHWTHIMMGLFETSRRICCFMFLPCAFLLSHAALPLFWTFKPWTRSSDVSSSQVLIPWTHAWIFCP